VLYLHEVHEVAGAREAEFERAFREGWLPALARGDEARLLYFLHHAHGTGPSYVVVTVTAVRDGAAWERLARRVATGDLAPWAAKLDALRRDAAAKLLFALPWSPLQALDLSAVPADGAAEHEPSVFMEDTVWPHPGRFEAYVERAGSHYAKEIAARASEGQALLEIQAAFRTAPGAGRSREIVLWQKLVQPKGLVALVTREVPERFRQPGTWLHDALDLRDRWESRLLRTARWSPLR
jgi:hypothetical protein